MVYSKKNALKKLEELKVLLINTTDDIFDDGSDNGDCEQNRRFTNETEKIDKVEKELAAIDVENIPSHVLNELWCESWSGCSNSHHLPENKQNHQLKYISALISKINESVMEENK